MASSAKADEEQESTKESKDLKLDPSVITDGEPENGTTVDAVMEEDIESGTTLT